VLARAQLDQGFVRSAKTGGGGASQKARLFQRQSTVHAWLIAVTKAEHVLGVRMPGRPRPYVGKHVREVFGRNIVKVGIGDIQHLFDARRCPLRACFVHGHIRAPHQQHLDVLGVPSLRLGIFAEVLARFLGGDKVVGSERHTPRMRSVVCHTRNVCVVKDARNQVFGARNPVGKDDSIHLLRNQAVRAFDRLFLVINIVTIDNVHAHLAGGVVDALGHAVGERDARQSIAVTDLPAFRRRSNFRFVLGGRGGGWRGRGGQRSGCGRGGGGFGRRGRGRRGSRLRGGGG